MEIGYRKGGKTLGDNSRAMHYIVIIVLLTT